MNTTSEPRVKAVWNSEKLSHVRNIIAVASGKGGVGKSTTAVNLALALAELGPRVGILDADIYGPSIPRMLGLTTRNQPHIEAGLMVPPVSFGLKAMSMGFILGREAAVLRAPMITKALNQMLRQVQWGTAESPLDILVVDMPPGTGDVHISMAQQVPLDGALVVTTPQEVAVMDADKSLQMFEKLRVPILGVIENMSYFVDPAGQQHFLFGQGGGERLAATHNARFLGALPLDPAMGTAADHGENYLERDGALAAGNFREIALALMQQL
jgi:ATP-binding protein involved in chromosome partitioning